MVISERSANPPQKTQAPVEPVSPTVSLQVHYKLRLFIAGTEPNSVLAKRNINEICSAFLADNFELDLIDVFQDFNAAITEKIVLTPALIVDEPKKARIIGNLQDKTKVLTALGLI